LTYSQGDRITIIALPLLLVALMLAVKQRKVIPETTPATSHEAQLQ
jgi:hypothetical protein